MEQLLDVAQYELVGIKVWVYFAALGSIILGFVGKKIVTIILKHLNKLAEKTSFRFDDMFFDAISKPLEWSVVLAGLFVSILILPIPTEPINVEKFVWSILSAASLAMIVWFAVRLVDNVSDWWAEKAAETESKLDDQLVPIIRRSLKSFLYIIGVVLILQNMGYSVESLLAGLGIGGLAMAMASKDTVANLFGSIVIFLDKPFQIGDWIETKDIEGTVEEIGLRTTRIRTFANSLITMPNALFTTAHVNNWSSMKKRRIKMTIGVTYSTTPDNLNQLVLDIRKIIEDDKNIKNDFYLVNFDNFGSSSLDIFIYCFTETTVWSNFLQVKQEFMLQIMHKVNESGLSFAFPTQSIHVESIANGNNAEIVKQPNVLTGQRPK